LEHAILILRMLLPTGFCLAPTSVDPLELMLLLFQQLAKRRHFPIDDLVLSKHTIRGADFVNLRSKGRLSLRTKLSLLRTTFGSDQILWSVAVQPLLRSE
jgi:hypothetical protein